MQRIDLTRRTSFADPTRVCIEASDSIVFEQDLDTLEGEQYDYIEGVIAIEIEGSEVVFTTARTLGAWKRGEPNAGRGEYRMDRSCLKAASY